MNEQVCDKYSLNNFIKFDKLYMRFFSLVKMG